MNKNQAAWRAAKALVPHEEGRDRDAFLANLGAKLLEKALLEFFERDLPQTVTSTDKARGLLERSALGSADIDDATISEACLLLQQRFEATRS